MNDTEYKLAYCDSHRVVPTHWKSICGENTYVGTCEVCGAKDVQDEQVGYWR